MRDTDILKDLQSLIDELQNKLEHWGYLSDTKERRNDRCLIGKIEALSYVLNRLASFVWEHKEKE